MKRELVLTPSADQVMSELVNILRQTTGTKLTHSHAARALLRVIAQRLPDIEHHAGVLPPLRLPSNAAGQEQERDRFETILAEALRAGLAGPG